MDIETINLMNLIQMTSGLARRKDACLFVNEDPVVEVRIVIMDGVPHINLVSESEVIRKYQVKGKELT